MVIRQDEELMVDQLLLVCYISDKECLKSNYEEEKKELESTTALTKISFCVSLRGEEFLLIVNEGLNMFWKENRNHCIPDMMMTLKGENNLRWYCVILAYKTKSGIPTRMWIS